MTSILIELINCRGVRNRNKRADIFHKAKEKHIDILCLQKTHITPDDLNMVKEDWNVIFI